VTERKYTGDDCDRLLGKVRDKIHRKFFAYRAKHPGEDVVGAVMVSDEAGWARFREQHEQAGNQQGARLCSRMVRLARRRAGRRLPFAMACWCLTRSKVARKIVEQGFPIDLSAPAPPGRFYVVMSTPFRYATYLLPVPEEGQLPEDMP
jgi:hypothetical protein